MNKRLKPNLGAGSNQRTHPFRAAQKRETLEIEFRSWQNEQHLEDEEKSKTK